MCAQIIVWLLIAHQICIKAFNRTVTLNNTRVGASGIGLAITATHVDTTDDILHINPPTQDGTDLLINMNHEWGFHPSVPSTISITITGFTPNKTKEDGEFFILFGVDNKQYFSVAIMLEHGQAWKSYPPHNTPLAATDNINVDLIYKVSPFRWDRLSNNDNWKNIGGAWYKKALEWPLNIQITNDPIANTTNYQCILSDKTLSVTYNTSFKTNIGLQAYIMNDASDNKPFDIYSIDVTYTYFTEAPTNSPTTSPTVSSIAPTVSPFSLSPTKSPFTPSPIIVIKPTSSTTKSPTNEGQQLESTDTTISATDPYKTDIEPQQQNNLMMYLVIIIIVLLCCFCIVCIGFSMLYKKKKNTESHGINKREYHQPSSIKMEKPNLKQVPSQSQANTIISHRSVSNNSCKVHKHHSIPMEDDEEFHDQLGNNVALDAAIMGDIVNDMATRGGNEMDDNEDDDEYNNDNNSSYKHSYNNSYNNSSYNNEYNNEYNHNDNNNINNNNNHYNDEEHNEYAEGGHMYQKSTSSVILEGHETIGMMPNEEKNNSLIKDQRTELLEVNTADGDEIIDDELETIGGNGDQPK